MNEIGYARFTLWAIREVEHQGIEKPCWLLYQKTLPQLRQRLARFVAGDTVPEADWPRDASGTLPLTRMSASGVAQSLIYAIAQHDPTFAEPMANAKLANEEGDDEEELRLWRVANGAWLAAFEKALATVEERAKMFGIALPFEHAAAGTMTATRLQEELELSSHD